MRFNRKDSLLRQRIYKQQYLKKLCLFLSSHMIFQSHVRQLGTRLLLATTNKTALSRVKNRCSVTGRGRAVYAKLRISRIVLKEMVGYGLLPGYHNASF